MLTEDELFDFYHEFHDEKFYKLEELTSDIIDLFKNEDGELSNYVEYSLGTIYCTVQSIRIKANVKISAKNRCIYIQPDVMNFDSLKKLDYSDRMFNVISDIETKTVCVDGFIMYLGDEIVEGKERPYTFNMTSLLLKYSDIIYEKGVKTPKIQVVEDIEPFYIDNKIRLEYDIDLKQVYSEYVAEGKILELRLREIKYRKFNDYGDIELGGTANLFCSVPSADQIMEQIKEDAKFVEENDGFDHNESLIWASDYCAISSEITSSFSIRDFTVDKIKHSPSFWMREDLFEGKHIYGFVPDLSIYIFMDSSRTAGVCFEFNDCRQYYLFGEYLMIMKANYQSVLRTLKRIVAEEEDVNNKIKCPVCGAYNEEGANICKICHFDELSPIFLNSEDALNWEVEVVKTYKEKYYQN